MKTDEIVLQDAQLREQGGELPSRQQYYTDLRDTLHKELMHKGYSGWLEQLYLEYRSGERTKLYVLDYAALMECHSMIVSGKELRDATVFIPHVSLRGEKARWEMLDKPGSHQIPFTKEAFEKLRQLRGVSYQVVDARNEAFAVQEEEAVAREVEQVQTLNRLLDAQCQSLRQERDELLARVRQLEEGIITDQVHYAIEARRVTEERALQEAYARKHREAEEAWRAQFGEAAEKHRLQQEKQDRASAALLGGVSAEYAAVRTQMADELAQLQQVVADQVARWQGALDRTEYRMLAQSYVSLHGFLSSDMAELVQQALAHDAAEEFMTALAEKQQGLRDRLRQLEQAMLRLGLNVLRPEPGERYDRRLHVPAGTMDGTAAGRKIIACVTPGVVLAATGEALVKAAVTLE